MSHRKGYIIVGIVLLLAIVCCGIIIPGLNRAGLGMAQPAVSVPGEQIPGTPLTNTFVGTLLADVVIVVIAFLATRNVKEVPGRLQLVFEFLVSFIDNMAHNAMGPKSRRIFPIAFALFFFILVANWLELVPGVDSIGAIECVKPTHNGYNLHTPVLGFTPLFVDHNLDRGTTASAEDFEACEKLAKGGALSAEEQIRADLTAKLDAAPKASLTEEQRLLVNQATDGTQSAKEPLRPNLYQVTSFVRAAATDLNLTLALAVIAFFTIQYFGVKENGGAYFYKFFNVPALAAIDTPDAPLHGALGPIDFVVGFLELITELARILSFGFRLFGNIFAGQVLLFVITFLVAALVPIVFYGLELFVGAIQAFVFTMLLIVFSSMAMVSHHGGGGHEGDEHSDDPANAH